MLKNQEVGIETFLRYSQSNISLELIDIWPLKTHKVTNVCQAFLRHFMCIFIQGDAIDRSIGKLILITTHVCGIKPVCAIHQRVTFSISWVS
jgi:hypothetical protein